MAGFQRSASLFGKALLVAGLAAAGAVQAQPAEGGKAGSAPVYAGDVTPGGGEMFFDLVLARPLGLVGTVLGSAAFIVSLPFDAISGDVSGPARKLIEEPAQFTFSRPLGQFD